nr:MAG TPA: hypothetical protein [Caudoviricetes sp.]
MVCGRVFYCINVMLPDFRADIIYMKKSAITRQQPLRHLGN